MFQLYFRRDRIRAIALVLLIAALYLPFIGNPLVFDDLGLLGNGAASRFADAHFDLTPRWFPYTTFGVTWVFFGEDPPVFRVQNMLLHALNALLLWLLLRIWIQLFVRDTAGQRMAEWGAWLGALVFACHPLAVYGTAYLVQRSILMATFFSLLMQIVYLRALLENKPRYLLLTVAAYFLAVFSKEHSILSPAILLLLTWLLRKETALSLRALTLTWLGMLAVAVLVVLRMKGIIGAAYEPDVADLAMRQMLAADAPLHGLSILTQAGLFLKYLGLMLLPYPGWMSIDMRETFLSDWQTWTAWMGLLAYLLYGVLALLLFTRGGRQALCGLAMLYPWLQFPTEFSAVRMQEIFVLYRSYLWLPGVMLLLPLLLERLDARRTLVVAALLLALLIPASINRLWVFADDLRLWDEAVRLLHGEERLGAERTYYGRAHARAERKEWEAAIADYRRSLAINPGKVEVHMALASAYYGARRYQEALAELDEVIRRDARHAKAHFNKGMLLKQMHDEAGAMQSLQTSCDLGAVVACATISIENQRRKMSPLSH